LGCQVSFYNELWIGVVTKISGVLVLEGLYKKLWNFNTLSLLQQSDSSSINLFEKEIDPTLLQRSILTPVAEPLPFLFLWLKKFAS